MFQIGGQILGALSAEAEWWRIIQFGRPLWLVGLLAIVPVVYLWMTSRVPGSKVRRHVSLWLRIVLVVALVLGLSEARLSWPDKGVCVAFLIDQSQSVPQDARELIRGKIDEQLQKMTKDDQFMVIEFGGDAVLEALPSYRGKLPEPVQVQDSGRTDISRAIRLAVASFPPDKQKRIVLLSDGNQNVGDALRQARIAGASHVDVTVLPLIASVGHEVMVDQLSVPERVQKDADFVVRTMISSDLAQGGKLTLLRDGRAIQSNPVQLKPGMNVFDIKDRLSDGGFHQYEVQIDAPQDTFRANNFSHAFTRVEAPGRVLVIHGQSSDRDYLYDALIEDGVQADRGFIDRLPTTITGLMAYDCVVLDNVPIEQFRGTQPAMLQAWVQDNGGGLVMVGGGNSFGPGGYGYKDSPLEAISPVEMEIKEKKHQASVAVVIVLDKSGSMGYPAGGGKTKMDLANNGSIEALKLMSSTDWAQIGAVDTDIHWMAGDRLIHLTDTNRARLRSQTLSNVSGGGGIYCKTALDYAYRCVTDPSIPAMARHVILFADTADSEQPSGCVDLARQYAAMSPPVTLTVIGLGEMTDSDVEFQQELARAGKGESLITNDPMKLPRLFLKDVFRVSRNAFVEKAEGFTPKLFDSPLLEGIKDKGVPKLYGYVGTTLKVKPRATEAMQGVEADDPVLAHWQTGLGKVVAFTSDSTNRWSKDWVRWDGYAKFWGQTVRWASRSAHNPLVTVTSRPDPGGIRIDVNMLDASGKPDNTRQLSQNTVTADPEAAPLSSRLEQVGPGHFTTVIPIRKVGGNVTTIKDNMGNPIDSIGTVMSYPPEFKDLTPNTALLKAMQEESHGRLLTDLADVFSRKDDPVRTQWPLWTVLMVVSGVLLVMDVAWRRLNVADLFRRVPMPIPGMGTASAVGALKAVHKGRSDVDQQRKSLRERVAEADKRGDASVLEPAGSAADNKPVLLDMAGKKVQAAPTEGYANRLAAAKRRAGETIKDHEKKDS